LDVLVRTKAAEEKKKGEVGGFNVRRLRKKTHHGRDPGGLVTTAHQEIRIFPVVLAGGLRVRKGGDRTGGLLSAIERVKLLYQCEIKEYTRKQAKTLDCNMREFCSGEKLKTSLLQILLHDARRTFSGTPVCNWENIRHGAQA